MAILTWNEVEYTAAAQTALKALTPTSGVLAVCMKKVNGGKIQVEFAQKIDKANTTINVLALLNASDERFNQSGPARTWVTTEPTDLKAMFGFEMTEEEEYKEILTFLPELNGNVFGLQIIEVPESKLPSRFQGEYLESNIKRAGKDGEFFYLKNSEERVGRYVELSAAPVGQKIEHTLIMDATIGKETSINDMISKSKEAEVNV